MEIPPLSTGFVESFKLGSYENGSQIPILYLQVVSAKLKPPKDPAAESTAAQGQDPRKYVLQLHDGADELTCITTNYFAQFMDQNLVKENTILQINTSKIFGQSKRMLVLTSGVPITTLDHRITVSAGNSHLAYNQNSGTNQLGQAFQTQPNNPFNPAQQQGPSAVPNTNQSHSAFGLLGSTQHSVVGQQQQAFNHNTSSVSNSSGPMTIPISALNPFQNKWTIKATVSFKSEIKEYTNQKGAGKLFNVHLLDDSDEIKATGFNEQADKFYNLLQVGKAYYISHMRVNQANKKFSNLSIDYELMFSNSTEIEECLDVGNAPVIKFNFVPISNVENTPAESYVDVLGVINEITDIQEFVSSKTQKNLKKRDVYLVDDSKTKIRFTLWGETATNFKGEVGKVLALRSAKVGDYQGKSLGTVGSTMVQLNPDLPEAYRLLSWYQSNNETSNFTSLQQDTFVSGSYSSVKFKTLNEIKDHPTFGKEKSEMFNCMAYSTIMKDNMTYPACPSKDCNKKVVPANEGFHCEKCNVSCETPDYRYIISAGIADAHSSIWVQMFDDHGKILMGMSGSEFQALEEHQKGAAMAVANFEPYVMTIQAKSEIYQDVQRVRYSIKALKKVESLERSQNLMSEIDQLFGQP